MPDRLSDASLIGGSCDGERLYCTPPTLHTANGFNVYIAVSHVTITPLHAEYAYYFDIIHTLTSCRIHHNNDLVLYDTEAFCATCNDPALKFRAL